MASIKIIFRPSSPKENEGTLYYRIIHKRKMRQIHSGIRIARDEWSQEDCNVVLTCTPSRKEYLDAVRKTLDMNVMKLQRIIAALDNSAKEYTAADVAGQYLHADTVSGFMSFARKIIAENREMNKISAVAHYSSALNSFIRFHGEAELPFDEFNSKLMCGYECYLKNIDLTLNTISYYMRKLRTMYNLAVERELTVQRNPFKHVYTGVAKTKKRAVSLDVIKTLRDLDLKCDPHSELARDMFLFSFYTRGMSFVDMAYLRRSNLRNGILSYRRHKTSRQLYIRWMEQMQEIVRYHDIPESDFMLPIIKPNGKDNRVQYQNAQHMINRRLKKLGARIGMTEPLTMYCARHAWASIALDDDVPVSVISQGMGHDSEKTTRIYLASLNTSVVDQANNKILGLLDL